MKVRMVNWWKLCLECQYQESGESEYLGLNFWYCPKCNSMHLQGGFTVDERESDVSTTLKPTVKKLELELRRKDYGDTATEGVLYINGIFECYTLEDIVRPVGVKIAGHTAIQADRYKIVIDFSDRFQRFMPHLLDVPMFTGIRIHSGNTSKNTEGCILVGTEKVVRDPDFIGSSRVAFDALFAKLDAALKRGEEVWITITDTKEI